MDEYDDGILEKSVSDSQRNKRKMSPHKGVKEPEKSKMDEEKEDSTSSGSDSDTTSTSDNDDNKPVTENNHSDTNAVSDEYLSNDSEDECAVFLCNECGKKFYNGTSLKAHLAKKHNPRALVNCELCEAKYRGEFAEHIETEHYTTDVGYFCKKCDFTCARNEDILKHHHDKNVCNVCKYCGKMYKSKENYKMHLLTHTNNDTLKKRKEKSFSCATCGKKFLSASLLKEHTNIHKSGSGTSPDMCSDSGGNSSANNDRPYKCNECGRTFFRSADLKKHSRSHTGDRPFVCDICGDCFSQNTLLRSHLTVHKDERLHTCDTCGKSFRKRADLIKHIRAHSQEKTYRCNDCGKCFKQSFELVSHTKRRHGSVSPEMQQSSVPLAV